MVVNESLFRDFTRLLVWYPLRWLVIALPVRAGILVLRAMGDLHHALANGRNARLFENLARIIDPADDPRGRRARVAVREYFRNHYIDRLFIFIFPKLGLKAIDRLVEIAGLEHLDRALAQGRGAILVHGHFGPVHLPLVVLARLGYRLKQIGLPSDEGLSWIGKNVAFRLRLSYEGRMPAQIIHAESFLRPAFTWLKDNGILMITGDGSGTEKRVGRHLDFPFFSQPALFPLGPSLLAGKTGAAILPLFVTPGARRGYRVVIEEPLVSERTGEDAAADLTGQFVRRFEARVAQHPGYMHFLDRFAPGAFIREDAGGRRAVQDHVQDRQ